MIEETLQELVNSIDNICEKLDPSNDFGQTVGDELAGIGYNLQRIADVLEKIEAKIK